MSESASNERDFKKLRESSATRGTTLAIGTAFVNARTRVATVLVRFGVRPNHLTVAGFVATLFAAACLLIGASHHAPYERIVPGVPQGLWLLWAALFLVLAGACDMLDGAVARVGGSGSRFGGVLDSTLDRYSDIAVYLGISAHFAYRGNVTYATLAVLAMCNGYMISYIKARSEDVIDDCSVGFWLRGERVAGLLFACLCFHIPAWLWLQAIAPVFTAYRRMRHTYVTLRNGESTQTCPPSPKQRGVLHAILSGDCPRGSTLYDVMVVASILFFLIAPWAHPFFYGGSDPLRRLLDSLLGG